MAARLKRTVAAVLLAANAGAGAAPADDLEAAAAAAARAGRMAEVTTTLRELQSRSPQRYVDGRFDYLAARALASTGKIDAALARFERYIGPEDLFDVPARLSAGALRFTRGDGMVAFELLLPLMLRKPGAVSRRALRIALDALETKRDPDTLARLAAARVPMAPRERRRLQALRAEELELGGDAAGARRIRVEILREGRRDDAAATVLAKELGGATLTDLPDDVLSLLVDTARAQHDLELAERLARERERRAFAHPDLVPRLSSRFDLARVVASRGRFSEAADLFRSILQMKPAKLVPPKKKKDDSPGTAAFFSRVRFNLGTVLEKLNDADGAVREFQRVESDRVGPAGLAVLQRARLEMRRNDLDLAEKLLARPALAKEPGRVEGILFLVERRCEKGDGAGAARALARLETQARLRLPEPWRSELSFWHGRVLEARGEAASALASYADLLATRPRSVAAELALSRIVSLPEASVVAFIRESRAAGEALIHKGRTRLAVARLLPAALLLDGPARELLKLAYERLPEHANVLLAPELPAEALSSLCGDAAACRLLQLGLAEEAEPIVRDARHLDSILGCILAARLAEEADAGPAALEAAEALERRIPDDFLLDLAPRSILLALAPRPFDKLVREAASENRVPAELLYAVMRQESRFDREAASPAAARGLMQLTLPAAGEAARELHEEPPAYGDLYDPARSLRLGAHTLRTLLDRFADSTAPVVAAYNAGAGQTALWCSGAKDPTEALLASISYPETRTYYRRVLGNRRLYRLAESVTKTADRSGSGSWRAAPPSIARWPR